MDVFVAGGAHSLVFGNFQRNLNDIGIHIVGHASMESKSYAGIPVGAAGVIIIKDMINHELSGKVVADAKARDLPYALVERKWSKAQAALMKTGFIKVPAPNTGIKAVETKHVVEFILEIRRLASRTATLAEVRKRFPLVTGDEYNVACGLASKHDDVKVMSDKEVATHIQMVLAEDYGMVKDENALFARTQVTFPEIATFITPSRVRAVIQDTLDLWKKNHQARDMAIRTFAVSRYCQFKQSGTGWVGSNELVSVVKPIFGTGGDWDWFCEARAEVFGHWALRLDHLVSALNEFNKRHPEIKPPISLPFARKELDEGRLKGFKQGYLYRSSVEALEEYVKERQPIDDSVLPPVAVPLLVTDGAKVDVDLVLPDVAVIPVIVPEKAAPAPTFDTVGLAELIESGIKIQLDQFTAKMEARIGEDAKNNADAVACIQRDVDTLIKGVTTTVNALTTTLGELIKVVQTTSAEVKMLRDHREAAKSDPADAKALNLGHALLSAKGAEVRFTLGDFKG